MQQKHKLRSTVHIFTEKSGFNKFHNIVPSKFYIFCVNSQLQYFQFLTAFTKTAVVQFSSDE